MTILLWRRIRFEVC